MVTLTISFQCECGKTTDGIISAVIIGGRAPIRCPACRKICLMLEWPKEQPTELVAEIGPDGEVDLNPVH